MKKRNPALHLVLAFILTACAVTKAAHIQVRNTSQLRNAIHKLQPGDTLLIAPGKYQGGIHLADTSGTQDDPIVIRGTDPNNPPTFSSGGQAIHLADCSYITLSNLKVKGFPANGINIDDAGSFETPAHDIILENITILETGPKGNHDALKMSGVDRFTIRRCRFEAWGGSAIDMVGCHHGLIEDCSFLGRKGFSQSNAVQLKGGTRHILVQTSLFKNAGQRAINLGGSTGLQFFRPKVDDYEAKNIQIAGNRFIGGITPLAWATADGGHVHHNTIILPDKWVLRILQEATDPRFKSCRNGVFENNLIIFDSKVQTFVNIGPGTAPETFAFRSNAWHDLDAARKPSLPTPEKGGFHQPKIHFPPNALTTGKASLKGKQSKAIGADAYTRPK